MTDEDIDDIDVEVFNDKSWVRLTDFMELKAENRTLKYSIEKRNKKIIDLIYNDENCLDKIIELLDDWEVDD